MNAMITKMITVRPVSALLPLPYKHLCPEFTLGRGELVDASEVDMV